MTQSSLLIVGGTHGIGTEIARHYAERGWSVVLAGRDESHAKSVAADVGGDTRGIALDLSEPEQIADALTDVARDRSRCTFGDSPRPELCDRLRHRQGTLPRDHEAGRLHRSRQCAD